MSPTASTPSVAYTAIFTRRRFFLWGRFTSMVLRGASKEGRFTSAEGRFTSVAGRVASVDGRCTSIASCFASLIGVALHRQKQFHSRLTLTTLVPLPRLPVFQDFSPGNERTHPRPLSVSENQNPKIEKRSGRRARAPRRKFSA